MPNQSLKIVSSQTKEMESSLYFQSNEQIYVFNCPDGFQRSTLLQKMKTTKMSHIFLSSLKQEHCAGFPGLYLTCRETSKDYKNFMQYVYGPNGLYEMVGKCKPFMTSLHHVKVSSYTDRQKWGFQQQEEGKEEESKGQKVGLKSKMEDWFDFQDKQIKVTAFPAGEGDNLVFSFFLVPAQVKGKFNAVEAKRLGCKPNKHFKILNEGKPVTLEDGTVIQPSQVLEKSPPITCTALFFIPSLDHLPSFLKNARNNLEPYLDKNLDKEYHKLSLIYHCTTLEILQNPDYLAFIQELDSEEFPIEHLVDTVETNEDINFRAQSLQLTQRHQMTCPGLFPLQVRKDKYKPTQEMLEKIKEGLKWKKVTFSRPGLVYNFFPLNQFQGFRLEDCLYNIGEGPTALQERKVDQILQTYIEKYYQELSEIDPDFNKDKFLDNQLGDGEPQILFLGTSSMKPGKYRGASAIIVYVNQIAVLMDCAEGSYAQICDHMGSQEQIDKTLRDLKTVFITHIHGDHSLGILKILSERDKLYTGEDNKIFVVTPRPIIPWIKDFIDKNLKHKKQVVIVDPSDLNPEKGVKYYEDASRKVGLTCPIYTKEEAEKKIQDFSSTKKEIQQMFRDLSKFGMQKILAIEADHCEESYGCLLIHQDFRLLYSGDTRPVQTMINYGQEVDLLLHEATFDDTLEQESYYKRHTTTGQAIGQGIKMKAKRTCLTHFSPRYQKIALVDDRNYEKKVMVSFDHMRIKLKHFDDCYKLLHVFNKCFDNDSETEFELGKTQIKKQHQEQTY